MNCRICKDKGLSRKAVIFLPHHNLSLCKDCFLVWYEHQLDSTIRKMKMFTRKDKILVAISGGKDSLALWYALTRLGYKADGIHIDLGIDRGNYSPISRNKSEALSRKINRTLHIVEVKKYFGEGIFKLQRLTRQPACSICGMVKRYFINTVALQKGYFCVVTGHNLDDEVATLFSSTLSWDIDTMGRQNLVLSEKPGFARKAKPLVRFTEKEDVLYCLLREIDYIKDNCPFSTGNKSLVYKRIFNEIENNSPGTKLRFYFNFQRNLRPVLSDKSTSQLYPCPSCGQPTTSSSLCAFCRLKEKIKNKVSS